MKTVEQMIEIIKKEERFLWKMYKLRKEEYGEDYYATKSARERHATIMTLIDTLEIYIVHDSLYKALKQLYDEYINILGKGDKL